VHLWLRQGLSAVFISSRVAFITVIIALFHNSHNVTFRNTSSL
jgi:hypothetical protein